MADKSHKLNVKVVSLAVATTATIFYVACILYGLWFLPNNEFHHQAFSLFVGFQWLTVSGFVLGLIQMFVYAGLTGAVFAWVYNLFLDRFK